LGFNRSTALRNARLRVGGEIVVIEENGVFEVIVPAELLDDVLRRAEAVLLSEHAGYGAKRTVEGAAPRRLDRVRSREFPAPGIGLEEREVRIGDRVQVVLHGQDRVMDDPAVRGPGGKIGNLGETGRDYPVGRAQAKTAIMPITAKMMSTMRMISPVER